jgi:hypothetical protein
LGQGCSKTLGSRSTELGEIQPSHGQRGECPSEKGHGPPPAVCGQRIGDAHGNDDEPEQQQDVPVNILANNGVFPGSEQRHGATGKGEVGTLVSEPYDPEGEEYEERDITADRNLPSREGEARR